MARVTRAAVVDSDLLEIWLYIAEDNPRAADELLDRIDTVEPSPGRHAPDGRDQSLDKTYGATLSADT